MTLLSLDLNASRARAVCGPEGHARPTVLDGNERELPLALNLEGRRAEVGRAALRICRRLPHLVCLEFLPHFDRPREWKAGQHKLDASKALAITLEALKPVTAGVRGVTLTLPAYLNRAQVTALTVVVRKARWPLLGSVSLPLAAAWAANAHRPWHGLALVLDADDHALTWTALAADEPGTNQQARVLQTLVRPLGVRAWKERLLNGIADRCIRQNRRDLRDSADAEQTLYDQLDDALDACAEGRMVELVIQAAHWCQNLFLPTGELEGLCGGLLRQTVASLHALLAELRSEGPPAQLLVSPAAARLPGLLNALQEHTGEPTAITLLSPDSAARAAHDLAVRWRGATLPEGHLDTVLPLPRRAAQRQVPTRTRDQGTKLPPRRSKLLAAEDDFSVTIDD